MHTGDGWIVPEIAWLWCHKWGKLQVFGESAQKVQVVDAGMCQQSRMRQTSVWNANWSFAGKNPMF